jgi:hypothetical protein
MAIAGRVGRRMLERYRVVDLAGIEPATSSMPWKSRSCRPLTQKGLIAGGTGRTVILGAILLPNCYQKHGKWVRG